MRKGSFSNSRPRLELEKKPPFLAALRLTGGEPEVSLRSGERSHPFSSPNSLRILGPSRLVILHKRGFQKPNLKPPQARWLKKPSGWNQSRKGSEEAEAKKKYE